MSYTVVVYAQEVGQDGGAPVPTTPDEIMNDDYPFGMDGAEFDERPRLGDLDSICYNMWLNAVRDCFDRGDGLAYNEGTHEFRFTAFVLNHNGNPVWKSKTFSRNVNVVVPEPCAKFAE